MNSAPIAAWVSSSLVATRTPVVSLSSRCTIPGRSSPPMPGEVGAVGRSALTSVPDGVPGRGMDDQPGRLVDGDEVARPRRGRRAACPRRRARPAPARRREARRSSPARSLRAGLAASPFTVTSPSSIRRLSCERVKGSSRAARNWSSALAGGRLRRRRSGRLPNLRLDVPLRLDEHVDDRAIVDVLAEDVVGHAALEQRAALRRSRPS